MTRTLPVLLALAACTGADDTDLVDTDVDSDVDSDTDTDPFDPCGPQDPSPTTVAETQQTGTYPAPAGGAITDGVYDLAVFDVYSPATADDHVRARRLVIAGDAFVSINVDDGGIAQQVGGTWTTTGTTLSFTSACPTGQAGGVPYTASGDEIWLQDTSEPNVQVYRRR